MSRDSNGAGLGLIWVLVVVFVVLKLTDNIDWSWWWVLSPLWIAWGIALSLFAFAGLLWSFKAIGKKRRENRTLGALYDQHNDGAGD